MLTLNELQKKDTKTLEKELANARKACLLSGMSLRMRQDKKSHAFKEHKTTIAHIEMILRERALNPER